MATLCPFFKFSNFNEVMRTSWCFDCLRCTCTACLLSFLSPIHLCCMSAFSFHQRMSDFLFLITRRSFPVLISVNGESAVSCVPWTRPSVVSQIRANRRVLRLSSFQPLICLPAFKGEKAKRFQSPCPPSAFSLSAVLKGLQRGSVGLVLDYVSLCFWFTILLSSLKCFALTPRMTLKP